MFKIIIADDEGFIRKGIIAMLKRNLAEEITFYEAETGNAALELVETIKPSLVITDIQMPGLNGLDFIEALRTKHHNISVVIISGYENFKYAQKAITLGVKKYVTKPINKPEFIDLVSQELKSQKKQSLYQKNEFHKKLAVNAMQKELRERLLLQLLSTHNHNCTSDVIKQLKDLEVNFHATLYTCVIIQYHSEAALDFLDFSIANIVQEYLSTAVAVDYICSAKSAENAVVIVASGAETKSFLAAIQTMFFEIIGKLITFYHHDFFAGVGGVVYEPGLLYRALESAQTAVNYKLFDKERRIQLYGQLEKGTVLEANDLKELEKAMASLEEVKIVQAFSLFLKNPYTRQNLIALTTMYDRLHQELLRQISLCQYQNDCVMPRLCAFGDLWSIPAMNQGILIFCAAVKKHTQALPVSQGNQKLLGDIIRYIREHLSESIDLNMVADAFGRNPAYISTLFKKGIRLGFNDYLTHERIELSKKHLQHSSLPIHEIAALCGYTNPKYYSVVFKKCTGLTPGQYREQFV